jgi:hypothetical protein
MTVPVLFGKLILEVCQCFTEHQLFLYLLWLRNTTLHNIPANVHVPFSQVNRNFETFVASGGRAIVHPQYLTSLGSSVLAKMQQSRIENKFTTVIFDHTHLVRIHLAMPTQRHDHAAEVRPKQGRHVRVLLGVQLVTQPIPALERH